MQSISCAAAGLQYSAEVTGEMQLKHCALCTVYLYIVLCVQYLYIVHYVHCTVYLYIVLCVCTCTLCTMYSILVHCALCVQYLYIVHLLYALSSVQYILVHRTLCTLCTCAL